MTAITLVVDRLRSPARSWQILLASQCLSSVGTWTTRIAVAWLLYRLTRSVVWLGIAAFSGQVAVLLLSPLAATVLDRWPRKRVLLLTQSLFCLQALALFCLANTNALTAGGIVCLGMIRGAIAAFDLPARQAFLSELVGATSELKQAIALDGLQVNVARVAGPLLAGFLISLFDEGSCFLFDGISYLIALAGLSLTCSNRAGDERYIANDRRSARPHVGECWAWLRRQPELRLELLLLAATSSLCLPFTVALPQYVHDVLKEAAPVLGTLVAFSGIGAIAATILLCAGARFRILDGLIRLSGGAAGICLAGLSMVQTTALASIIVAALSFFIMLQLSASAAFIQGVAPPNMRGRLAAAYSACSWGVVPFGSLFTAALAHWLGPTTAFMAGGIACALIAAVAIWQTRSGEAARRRECAKITINDLPL